MCALVASLNPSVKGLPGWSCVSGAPSTKVCNGSTSSWTGVTCNGGVVKALLLGGMNLAGTIPSQLGLLSGLDRLELQSNRINGSIPTSMGNASSLMFLNLADNSLVGTVPSTLGLSSNLRYLNLGRNSLTGTIPSSLCLLTSLSYVNVANNNLACYRACLTSVATVIVGTGVGECVEGMLFE